jgi:hypothetical protein
VAGRAWRAILLGRVAVPAALGLGALSLPARPQLVRWVRAQSRRPGPASRPRSPQRHRSRAIRPHASPPLDRGHPCNQATGLGRRLFTPGATDQRSRPTPPPRISRARMTPTSQPDTYEKMSLLFHGTPTLGLRFPRWFTASARSAALTCGAGAESGGKDRSQWLMPHQEIRARRGAGPRPRT